MTTAPCPICARTGLGMRHRPRYLLLVRPKPAAPTGAASDRRKDSLTAPSGTRSCGRLGPGQTRLHRAQVERQDLGVLGRRRRVGPEQLLLLGVPLDQLDLGFGSARSSRRYCERLRVDGEKAHRGAVLRGHVGRSWPGRPPSCRGTPGPKYSTNLPTTPSLRRICVTVSTRSVAVAPGGSRPVSSKPITSGMSM